MAEAQRAGTRRAGTEKAMGSRDVRAVVLGLFAVAYGTNVSTPFLVIYQQRMDLSPSQTMAIFVVYIAGIFLTLFIAGPLSDRYGRRAIMVPFVLLSALSSLILILGRDRFWLLLSGRALLGMVSGCVLGVGAAWIQELLGKGNEQRAAVLLTMVTYVGFGFGPITSALLAETLPSPLVTPFVVHIVFTLVLLPWLVRARETVKGVEPLAPIRLSFGVPASQRRAFLMTIVPPALWVFAFASTSFALFPVLLGETIGESGLSASKVIVAGVAGTLTALSGVLARPLVNRVGSKRALPIGVGLGAVGYLLGSGAYFLGAWLLLLPAAVILGTSSGTLTAGCLTRLGEMSDDETRGACVSTFYLLAYPGMAVPLVITALASQVGIDAALVLMCAAGVFAAMVVSTLARLESAPAGHRLRSS